MTWFTDDPWPLIFILGFVACVLLAMWASEKHGGWLAGALLAIVAAVAVFFVEKSIVTERERVAQKVIDLKSAFVAKDRDGVLSYFSLGEPELRDQAVRGLNMVEFPNGLDIKDMDVRLSNEDTLAVTRFRAIGTASVLGLGSQHSATRWDVTWRKEGKDWKIIQVERLNLLKDEKVGIFDARAN